MINPELQFPNDSESIHNKLLTDAIQTVIENADTRVNGKGELGLSKNRIASYGSFKKIIEAYQIASNRTYKVKDVNVVFAKEFLNYLLHKKNYSKSYALKKIRDLKTVCRSAKLDGIEIDARLNTIESPKSKKQNIIFLTLSELQKIKNLFLEDSELLNARKWLLIGCYTGQRVVDLFNLNEIDFVTTKGIEVIEIKQEKTGQLITIPTHPIIKEILEEGLPVKIPVQKLNSQIKKLCQLAKIDNLIEGILFDENSKRKTEGQYEKYKLITAHVFRRTYAMNNYGKIPTSVLKKITGHTTNSIFLSYIGKGSINEKEQTLNLF